MPRRSFTLALCAALGASCGPRAPAPTFYASPVPTTPAEAFDLEAIKAAQLTTLGWAKTEDSIVDGVRMVGGTFSPGAYTGPLADRSATKTITMRSRARLYFPAAATQPLPLLVHAAHIAELVPAMEGTHRAIVSALGIAVLVHGEDSSDWTSLGYPKTADQRGALVDDGLAWLLAHNACSLSDLLTGNFGYALAKTNLLAQTLGRRLLEASGQQAGPAGQYGASKEGYATWVAAAADDRLVVAAPSRFQRLDVESLGMYERNSGCGPNGATAHVSVPGVLSLRQWLTSTDAGRAAARVILPSGFVDQLRPAALLINSDIGMWWLHDGHFFTVGADTHFLDGFVARPFRHARFFEAAQGTSTEPAQSEELGNLAQLLTERDPAAALRAWPDVLAATASDDGATFSFRVTVNQDPDIAHVRITLASSPNREFNDASQAPWVQLELTPETAGSTTWVGTAPASLDETAWYAEVEETVTVGAYQLPRRHVTPVRLLRELPPNSCPPCSAAVAPPACYQAVSCP